MTFIDTDSTVPVKVDPHLYWRDFNRTEKPDLDKEVDDAFAQSHISKNDLFGQLLLQGKAAELTTLHDAVMQFYGKDNFQVQVFGVADGCKYLTPLTSIIDFSIHGTGH